MKSFFHRFNCTRRITFVFASILLFSCLPSVSSAVDFSYEKPKKILFVTSYGLQSEWTGSVLQSFNSHFDSKSYTISYTELGIFNTVNFDPLKSSISWILERVERTSSDIIVILDEPAIRLVADNFSRVPKDKHIVFVGHFGDEKLGVEDEPNVHFVDLRVALRRNINFAKDIFPEVDRMVMIADGGMEGEILRKHYNKVVAEMKTKDLSAKGENRFSGVKFDFISGKDFSTSQMLEKVKTYPKETTMFLFYSWGSQKDGFKLLEGQYTEMISSIVNKNMIVFYDDTTSEVIGGYMISGVEVGTLLGQKVKDFLDKGIPIKVEDPMALVSLKVNWQVFTDKDLPVEAIPEDVEFYNVQKTLWDALDYRNVSFVLLVITLIVVGLFIVSYRMFLRSKRNALLLTQAKDKSQELAESLAKVAGEANIKNKFLATAADITGISFQICDEFQRTIGDSQNLFDGEGGNEPAINREGFFLSEDMLKLKEAWKDFVSSGASKMEILCASDFFGERRYYIIHAMPYADESDGTKKFLIVHQDVTKSKRDEYAIRDVKNMLSSVIDSVSCSIFVKNFSQGNKYVLFNRYYLENEVGREIDLAGKTDFDVFDKTEADAFYKEDSIVVETGKPHESVTTTKLENGEIKKSHMVKTAKLMENGDTYIMGVSFDMTELFDNQERIKIFAEHQKLLNDCLTKSMQSESFEEIMGEITELVGEHFAASKAFAYEFDSAKGAISEVAHWKRDESDLGDIPDFSVLTAEEVRKYSSPFEEKGVLTIKDFQHIENESSQKVLKVVAASNCKELILVGNYDSGKLVGFMGVDFIASDKVVSDSDEKLMASIGKIVDLIYERHKNLEKIREEEEHRRRILDSIQVPVMLFDTNKTLVTLNNAAIDILGKSREELMAHSSYEEFLKIKGGDPKECPVARAMESQKSVQTQVSMNGRDYIATGTPIFDADGTLINVMESRTDITEILDANKKLEEATRIAQESERSKSYFLATMSHELRTPLNAVIGYSELTQSEDIDQVERMGNLRNISFAANTLLGLINDILDLSKLEAGQVKINNSPIDVKTMVEDFKSIFKFSVQKKNIYIHSEVPENVPTLMLDLLRFKQVLMNVIGNAVKFTHKGGIDIKVTFDKKSEKSGDLDVYIKDSGIGMTPEGASKVFNSFEQVHTNRVRGRGGYEGTGLGLAIVKRLMENMNGEITVESELGAGTTFKMHFSNVEISDEIPEAETVKTKEQSAIKAAGANAGPEADISEKSFDAKILIVDDIILNLGVLGKMLKGFGVEVIKTTEPKEVPQLVKKYKPDMVMTDLWMPEMNGEELAAILRRDAENSSMPIIAVTADVYLEDKDKLFNGILFKPITKSGIFEVIEKYLPSHLKKS